VQSLALDACRGASVNGLEGWTVWRGRLVLLLEMAAADQSLFVPGRVLTTVPDLLDMGRKATQAARGLETIHSQQYIHR
jgi:hypothetical protein